MVTSIQNLNRITLILQKLHWLAVASYRQCIHFKKRQSFNIISLNDFSFEDDFLICKIIHASYSLQITLLFWRCCGYLENWGVIITVNFIR